MESCESSNKIKYKITDLKKFINIFKIKVKETHKDKELKDDDLAETIANDLGVSIDTVEEWLNHEVRPSTFNLELAVQVYKLNPEECGLTLTDENTIKEENNIQKGRFAQRLKDLLAEKNMKQVDLANALNETTSKISKWCNGKNVPKPDCLEQIANFFNVSTSYLKCETNIRHADNELFYENLGTTDSTINNLKEIKNRNMYGKTAQKDIKDNLFFDHQDIINFINSDKEFFDVLYLEVYRVLEYYDDIYYKGKFDELFNEITFDLTGEDFGIEKDAFFYTCNDSPTPYIVKIETIAKCIICKKLEQMFDKYICEKKKLIDKKPKTKKNWWEH